MRRAGFSVRAQQLWLAGAELYFCVLFPHLHPQDQRLTLERLQVVYTVGYSLSLATLLFALLILSTFRWDPPPPPLHRSSRDWASVFPERWG